MVYNVSELSCFVRVEKDSWQGEQERYAYEYGQPHPGNLVNSRFTLDAHFIVEAVFIWVFRFGSMSFAEYSAAASRAAYFEVTFTAVSD